MGFQTSPGWLEPDRVAILTFLDWLHPRDSGHVYEIRLPKSRQFGTVSGYYAAADNARAAEDIASWTSREEVPGVYALLSPCLPDLLARGPLQRNARETTTDDQIIRRRALLVDIDPITPAAGISSSDAEKAAAAVVCDEVRQFLVDQGFPEPLVVDSGNGWHMLFKTDLAPDDASTALVKALLVGLARRFTGSAAMVDTAVGNLARITKIAGSVVRKGANVTDRPWRVARIVSMPVKRELVTVEMLERAITALPPVVPKNDTTSNNGAQASSSKTGAALLEVEDALRFINSDDRDVWLRIGMALRDEFGDAGRQLWGTWSASSAKFDVADQEKTWSGFKAGGGITLGTLFKYARDGGWGGGGGKPRTTFLGFLDIEQVRDQLVQLEAKLRADINIADSSDYVAAAAALDHFDRGEYARLAKRLKSVGLSGISRWERAVFDRRRKEDERLAEEAQEAKAQAKANEKYDSGINIVDIEPADQPVADLGVLLNEVKLFIRRFVVLSDVQAVAVVLWICFAHAFKIADYSPRLAIMSAKKRSGKSRLEDILELLLPRVLRSSNTTSSIIYRVIEEFHPTLVFDEVDSFMFGGKRAALSEEQQALRGIINSGWTKGGAFVLRNEKIANRIVPSKFSTWAPIVLAAIGSLPDTLEDRSVRVTLKRRLKLREPIEKITRRNSRGVTAEGVELARKLARAIGDRLDALRVAEPEIPPGLDDRCDNSWDLMLAIAEAAGDTWAKAARDAMVELSQHRDDGEEDLDEKLLADIGTILDQGEYKDARVIGSTALCGALRDAGSPWDAFGKTQKPITGHMMARLLKPFGVYPAHQRTGNEYTIAHLRDAIERLLPTSFSAPASEKALLSFTPSQNTGGEEDYEFFNPSQPALGEGLKSTDSLTGTTRSEDVKVKNANFGVGTEKRAQQGPQGANGTPDPDDDWGEI